MPEAVAIKVKKFLTKDEIQEHLENVEYIMLAGPSANTDTKNPIHFTIFLNTQDALPEDISAAVLEKFCHQYRITHTFDMLYGIEPVAFAQTDESTLMPMHLFKEEDIKAIEHGFMYIYDFEGNSPDFKEPKEGLTGWTYSYN